LFGGGLQAEIYLLRFSFYRYPLTFDSSGDGEVIYCSRCVGGEEVGLGVVISAISTSMSELFVVGISSNSVSMETLWSVITFLQSFS
jgi:hypothetical protein